jgi:hypothetical protein
MLPKTHKFIIEHTLQFRRKNFKGFEKQITEACINEDKPRISLDPKDISLFGLDHFYNPKSKTGYSRFFLDAKTKGIHLFNKAFELYKEKRFKESFYTLGRSTHYLQDIASPSHTKLIFHLIEDDFEKYVDENIHKFKFKIRSKLIPPTKPEECFERLAKKSSRIKYTKKNWMIGILWGVFKKRKQLDPDKRLNRMSRKMLKQCIIYTIALLNAFNRKIIRYNFVQKQKKFVKKIKEKKIVKKLREKSRKLVS